jgi:nitronate monooxygenase
MTILDHLKARGPLTIGRLSVPLPIVQGGMGVGISLSGLASAVANLGGIGVLSAACISRTPRYAKEKITDEEALTREIRRARSFTDGVFGVNIMVATANFDTLVRAAAEEEADIIFAGAGLPLKLPGLLPKGSKTLLAPIVSSAKAAMLLIKWWGDKYGRVPDAIVAEGPLAGGHLGFKPEQINDPAFSLGSILDPIIQAVRPIPVIAAGGIYSGGDIKQALDAGANAVQMGTRLVATEECDAPDAFKQAYIATKKEDIVIVQSPVGMPGRALSNDFLRSVNAGTTAPTACRYHCIQSCARQKAPYCIADALLNSLKGTAQEGLLFAGANAWRIKEILPLKKLFNRLDDEFSKESAHE